MHAQTTALVDGEASARRSKKTFGPHGHVPAYGKDNTERRRLEAPFGGWVVSRAKGAFSSRNICFELCFQWLTKTGRSTCETGGRC